MEEQNKKIGKFQQLQNQIEKQVKQQWQKQQKFIKDLIIQKNDFIWDSDTIDLIAGVDISASKKDNDIACAALVIYSVKLNQLVHQQIEIINIGNQPYVPGFLAFRQIPILYVLFQKLKQKRPQLWPQLIIVDGNGILHQNQCGLACHLGVLLDTPTIGVGKTLFYVDGLGKQQVKLQCEQQIKQAGDRSLLKGKSGRIWGAAVRNSKNATNPIFVSIGHKIQLDMAIKCVLKLSLYRVVQPVRLADKISRQIIQNFNGNKQTLKSYPMIYLQK